MNNGTHKAMPAVTCQSGFIRQFHAFVSGHKLSTEDSKKLLAHIVSIISEARLDSGEVILSHGSHKEFIRFSSSAPEKILGLWIQFELDPENRRLIKNIAATGHDTTWRSNNANTQ